MRLNFCKLQIHNFKSFLDETFDFSKNFGMTLVCGKNLDIPGQANSAGKSSIFDALLYALFGQLQTSVKNKNLKNRYSKEQTMSVVIDFNIDGEKFYSIERGLNKYGSSFLKLFCIDSETNSRNDITKSSVQETEEFIENELLHCDVSIFLRTILLSSDQNYNFFMLTKSGKREFVEKLFNIKVFGEMYSLIHRDILEFEKDFSSKQTKLIMLNKSRGDLEEKIAIHERSAKAEIEKIRKNIDLDNSKLKICLSKQIVVNSDEVRKIEDTIDKLNLKKTEIEKTIRDKTFKEKTLISEKAKEEALKISDEKNINSRKDILSKLCEKCLPIASKYYNIDKTKSHLNQTEHRIAEIESILKSNKEDMESCIEKKNKIEVAVKKLERKIYEMMHEYNEISMEIAKLKNFISINETSLKNKEKEENPFKSLYDSTCSEIDSINSEIAAMNIKYNYMKMAENIVSQDTLKKFIIKDLITLLNSKIKYYLMKLGAKYTCVFNEDMDYTFITPDNGGETEYATFSAGERMRLSIASSFAFRDFMSSRNGFMSNILILDEFIDSAIDTLAVNNVLKILQDFSRMNNQHVMIISHRKEIDNSIFDNVVMVEKQNNISKISYVELEK